MFFFGEVERLSIRRFGELCETCCDQGVTFDFDTIFSGKWNVIMTVHVFLDMKKFWTDEWTEDFWDSHKIILYFEIFLVYLILGRNRKGSFVENTSA